MRGYIGRHTILNQHQETVAFRFSHHLPTGELRAADLVMALLDLNLSVRADSPQVIVEADQALLSHPRWVPPGLPLALLLSPEVDPTGATVANIQALQAHGCDVGVDLSVAPQHSALLQHVQFARMHETQATTSVRQVAASNGIRCIFHGLSSRDIAKGLGADAWYEDPASVPVPRRSFGLNPERVAALRLFSRSLDPDVSVRELETLILPDPVLCMRLLQVANSAAYSPRQPIETIRRAITLLGLSELGRWIGIILLGTLVEQHPEGVDRALVRARMCQAIARTMAIFDADRAFTVGLVSMFDALLGLPMESILDQIGLSESIRSAILRHEGQLGMVLAYVTAHERQQWWQVSEAQLAPSQWNTIWLESTEWAKTASLIVFQPRTDLVAT